MTVDKMVESVTVTRSFFRFRYGFQNIDPKPSALLSSLALCGVEREAERNEVLGLVLEDCCCLGHDWRFNGVFHDQNWLLYDKVTVLESEKRAWESSPEAQAIREVLNPWRNQKAEERKDT